MVQFIFSADKVYGKSLTIQGGHKPIAILVHSKYEAEVHAERYVLDYERELNEMKEQLKQFRENIYK